MPTYRDLADLKENDRIQIIGDLVMKPGASNTEKPVTVAFVVENDEKADRYIKKLEKKFPGIRVVERLQGPVYGTISIVVGGPLQ